MNSQTVYHGTATRNLSFLPFSPDAVSVGRLWVTDTPARAGRYANAQATRTVSAEYADLADHAVILVIETDDELVWTRRAEGHTSLDVAEATMLTGRIVAADIRECHYQPCTCHREAAVFRSQHGI